MADARGNGESPLEVEHRLIPVLREGVEIVKLIFFKNLKSYLGRKYPDREQSYINRLTGAILNELFGTPNTEQVFSAFVEENRSRIEEEMESLATSLPELRIPLTDALRTQFLCDHQEGVDSSPVLYRAKELGILIIDREVPLPAQFMSLVRRLGGTLGILAPLQTEGD
jgi:hypothetical protein